MAPSPASAPERARPLEWGALALILAAGAALRAFESGRAPMWFDEIYTTWAARGGFAQVVARLAQDVHPPLHTLLVAAWVALGGESTPWLRTLSIVFGLATIAFVYALGRATFGRGAALAAAALLALHPVHIYFSQESRVYALFWLETTAAWWAAWRWISSGHRRHGVAYVLAAALMLYTHYLSGLLLVFAFAGGLVLLLRGPGARRRALAWIGLHAAVAVLFAPQLPTFVTQQSRLGHEHWTGPADARDLRDWARRVGGGTAWQALLLTALGALALVPRPGRRAAEFLAWSSLGPVFVAWALSTRGAHLFTERYMYFVLPAVVVVVGGGLAAGAAMLRERAPAWRSLAWAVLALLLAFELRAEFLRPPWTEGESLADVSRRLLADARPGDVVWCADTHGLLYLAHYHPQLVRTRLLWFAPGLPYYEGALVIPDSLVATRAAFDSARAAGARWWGLRVRRGGDNGPQSTALFDSLAGAREEHYGLITLWRPE